MLTNVTLDIRCGYCNKKLSEITPPVTLMIQRIKCTRCGRIVDTYVIKETEQNNHKPKTKPVYNPVTENKIITPEETKLQDKLNKMLTLSEQDIKEL